jgi:hypothetical protein
MDVAQSQRDVRPGVGEHQGNRPAKAPSGSGHEGYLIRQVETGKRIHAI